MSSLEHIRGSPGFPRGRSGWPSAMSLARNLVDLGRHAEDFSFRKGFTYSVLDGHVVVGCVYLYPSRTATHDAEAASWVTAEWAELDGLLWKTVSAWLAETWPFERVLYAPRRETNASGRPS